MSLSDDCERVYTHSVHWDDIHVRAPHLIHGDNPREGQVICGNLDTTLIVHGSEFAVVLHICARYPYVESISVYSETEITESAREVIVTRLHAGPNITLAASDAKPPPEDEQAWVFTGRTPITPEEYEHIRIKYDRQETNGLTIAYDSENYPFVHAKVGEPIRIIVHNCHTFESAKHIAEGAMCTIQKIMEGAPCLCDNCVADNPILKIMSMMDIKSYYPAPR